MKQYFGKKVQFQQEENKNNPCHIEFAPFEIPASSAFARTSRHFESNETSTIQCIV